MYQIGETFQQDCSTRCTCRTGGQIDCITVPCPINGPTCTAAGDPHYTTFDGRRHDFQGSCEYVYVERCTNSEFSIRTRNFAIGNLGVSAVDEVTIEAPRVTIVMARGFPIPVTINGQPVTTNNVVLYNENGVEVRRVGRSVHVFLNTIGIRASWHGNSFIEVTVSTSLQNELCGLCGTYNGNPNDDLRRRDGALTTSEVDFGDSWLVPGSCRAVGKRQAQEMVGCSADPAVIQEGQNRCRVLREGVFSACNRVIDPTPFIENCEFDYGCIADINREEFYCDSLAAYAAACADAGVPLSTWRNSFCRKLAIRKLFRYNCYLICVYTYNKFIFSF